MLDYENLIALVGEWDEDKHKYFIELVEKYSFDKRLVGEDDSDSFEDLNYKWFKDELKKTSKENEYYETLKKLQSIVDEIVNKYVRYDCEYKKLKVEDLLKEVGE